MRERDLGNGELAKGPQAGAEPVPWGLGEGPRPGCGHSVETALKFCLGAVFVLVTKKLMLEAENEDGGGARGGGEEIKDGKERRSFQPIDIAVLITATGDKLHRKCTLTGGSEEEAHKLKGPWVSEQCFVENNYFLLFL